MPAVSSTLYLGCDMSAPAAETEAIRIDKWLWAARLFKTRHLAVDAINGGKVEIDGQRAKPAKTVRPGTRVTIHKESLSWEVTGCAASSRSASGARPASTPTERPGPRSGTVA
jgi:ribosome-associated heat shock protein Hsp15